ncbi:MAG: precorrin-8X methylmutase [Hyphomicrobiales bacterium]|nr:MAG: precorrin-8X methylmutase [Hyphomicrobiales bacterium]
MDYIREPQEIYRRSFAIVEQEAALDDLPIDMRPIAIRIIHACGMVDAVDDLIWSENAVAAGRKALGDGCKIFTDVEMVKAGIIARHLPKDVETICTLNDPQTPALAKDIGNTRSAAGVDLWGEALAGAIVVIGNAPTALFRLLELLDEGAPRPALILGFPVGFVGAAESKEELVQNSRGCEFITLKGRRGGSAIASAALNGLANGIAEGVGT